MKSSLILYKNILCRIKSRGEGKAKLLSHHSQEIIADNKEKGIYVESRSPDISFKERGGVWHTAWIVCDPPESNSPHLAILQRAMLACDRFKPNAGNQVSLISVKSTFPHSHFVFRFPSRPPERLKIDERIIFTIEYRPVPMGPFLTLRKFGWQNKEIHSTKRYDRMTSNPVISLIIRVGSRNTKQDWLLWGSGKQFSIGLYPHSVNSTITILMAALRV